MAKSFLFLLFTQTSLFGAVTAFPRFSPVSPSSFPGLSDEDCNIRCPQSNVSDRVVLPAITHQQNNTGHWENVLECWQIGTVTTKLPGIENSYRLDWEGGFDQAYQYIFHDQSFMQAHSTPEPSLIVMGSGIGKFSLWLWATTYNQV